MLEGVLTALPHHLDVEDVLRSAATDLFCLPLDACMPGKSAEELTIADKLGLLQRTMQDYDAARAQVGVFWLRAVLQCMMKAAYVQVPLASDSSVGGEGFKTHVGCPQMAQCTKPSWPFNT